MIKRLLIVAAALFAFAAVPAMAQTAPGYGGPATLTCSVSSGPVGTNVSCTGAGFAANVSATAEFHSQAVVVNSGSTGANGSFTFSFAVPNVAPGAHTITVTDASGHSASAAFTVTGATTGSTSTGTSGSGLAFTGAEIGLMTGGGALLLVFGGLIVLASRKRASA
jgi:hypothetical protein